MSEQRPIDQLIAQIVDGHELASNSDVESIVEHIALAPFSHRRIRAPARDRGLTYGQIIIGRDANALDLHLTKRVRLDRQWTDGTTTSEYIRDLRSAIRHPVARILAYRRGSDLLVTVLAPTANIVPAGRRGEAWLPNILVVYSTRQGAVLTGYMFSTLDAVNLPETVRWLR